MSRTDKDRPLWVRSLDSTDPVVVDHSHESGVCTLGDNDLAPDRPVGRGDLIYARGVCRQMIPSWASKRDHRSPGAPARLRKDQWWDPERARERRLLAEVVKAYRGDPEEVLDDGVDFGNFQHRRGATYDIGQ